MALIEKLSVVHLGLDMDTIIWKLEGSGFHTSKSMFQKIAGKSSKMKMTIAGLIWKHNCPKRLFK